MLNRRKFLKAAIIGAIATTIPLKAKIDESFFRPEDIWVSMPTNETYLWNGKSWYLIA